MKLLRTDKSFQNDDLGTQIAILGWSRENGSNTRIRRFVAVEADSIRKNNQIRPVKASNTLVRTYNLSRTQKTRVVQISRTAFLGDVFARIGLFAAFIGVVIGSITYITG